MLHYTNIKPTRFRLRLRNFTSQDLNLTNDLLGRCYIGDWFLLHLIARNTSAFMFRRIIKSLAENVRYRIET
jgi:hypothetical protein